MKRRTFTGTDVHSLIGLPSQSYSFRTRDRVQLTFANTGSSGQDGDAVVGHGTEIHDTVQGLTNHPCPVSVVLQGRHNGGQHNRQRPDTLPCPAPTKIALEAEEGLLHHHAVMAVQDHCVTNDGQCWLHSLAATTRCQTPCWTPPRTTHGRNFQDCLSHWQATRRTRFCAAAAVRS